MTETMAYAEVLSGLAPVRRRWRGARVAEGWLLLTATAAGALLVTAAADNALRGGPTIRWVLAAVLYGGTLFAAARWPLRRHGEDRRDDFFAAAAEQAQPELGGRIVSAVQLGRGLDYGSPEIVAAVVRDAAASADQIDPDRCVDLRAVRRALTAAGCAAVALAAYALAFGPRWVNGTQRVLAPWAHVPPYSRTILGARSVRPGNVCVPEG